MPKKSPLSAMETISTPDSHPIPPPKSRRIKPTEPISQTSTFVQMPPRRPRRSLSSAIVVVLIILLILAIGSYFAINYFKNWSEKNQQENQSIEQSSDNGETTSQSQTDPTADWLVFSLPFKATTSSATTTLFSFKYPKELRLTKNADNLILSDDNATSTQLNIYWVKSRKTLKDYLVALDKMNTTAWEGKPSVTVVTSTDAVVISGQAAVFRQQKLLAADLNQYIIYIKASDTVYAISLAAPELNENLLAFFVTFLNNFKFGQ